MINIIFWTGLIIIFILLVGLSLEVKQNTNIPYNNNEQTNYIDYDGMGNYSRYPKIKR